MSNLDELIQELCPNGVRFYELREIFDIKNGYTPLKSNVSYWENGSIPWFRLEDIRTNGRVLNDSLQHITNNAVKKSGLFKKKSIMISTTATLGEHAMILTDYMSNQQMTNLTIKDSFANKLLPEFAFYYCFEIGKKCYDIANYSGGIPIVNQGKFQKLTFPLPPLPVQREIVRILDNFTALEAELENKLAAELEARKKQYEYYRDDLFAFNGKVLEKELETEFPSIRNGFVGTVTSHFSDEDHGIRYLEGRDIHNGTISDDNAVYVTREFHNKHSKTHLKSDDIVVVQSGHVGECAVVGNKYAGANCHALIVMSNGGSCDSRYVAYYLQSSEGKRKLASITTGGTVKHILASKMKKIIVPFPPIEEQHRIVAILDRFDTLCNDLSSGLPAEIEARRKQYEYYRDRLLNFKEKP